MPSSQLEQITAIQEAIDSDLRSNPMERDPAKTFRLHRQRDRLFKKLRPADGSSESKAQDAAALEKFLLVNHRSGEWKLAPPEGIDEIVDATFRLDLWRDLAGFYFADHWVDNWDLGPGASRGCKTNDVYTKLFGNVLTTTSSGLYMRYVNGLRGNPTFLDAEKHRRKEFGPYKVVRGCKLSFVPKDTRASRVICTEPIVNMMAQKVIDSFLTRRLFQNFGIRLSEQADVNKQLARLGSLSQQWDTLDLQSASDCISVSFLRWCMPSELVRAILDARSPEVEMPDNNWLPLNMVSGMGNAFTFSMQTYIFASVLRACYKALDIDANVHCFGDDMVVDKLGTALVMRTLSRYGFIVNVEKSFVGCDPFRESCGGDYYGGRDVKPVYARTLVDRGDLFSLFNRLRTWSLRHGVPLFRTLLVIRRLIGKNRCYVPLSSDGRTGICCMREQALRYGRAREVMCRVHGEPTIAYESRIEVIISETLVVPEDLTLFMGPCHRGPTLALAASAGFVVTCVSGKAEVSGNGFSILEKSKPKIVRRVTKYTSCWPSTAWYTSQLSG